MWIPIIITIICTLQTLTKQYLCLELIDLPEDYGSIEEHLEDNTKQESFNMPAQESSKVKNRRYWLVNENMELKGVPILKTSGYEDEKDENLKNKISTLVQQTLHDTERKVKSIQNLKDKYREQGPYKAGFIVSMVKKSRDVLNELFNVAVKHRDDWKALEQMKLFELIVHTNVDTTNLVRQLVEIHIQHMNTSSDAEFQGMVRKRVVLL